MASLFLSHTSADKDRARAIYHDLTQRGFDEAEIAPGDNLLSRIGQAIEKIDCLAVLLSRESVSAPWVVNELREARWTHRLGGRVRVVPLLLADCDLPAYLLEGLYLDLRDDQDAALSHLSDLVLGRSAEVPAPLQLQLAELVTAAGPGRWSSWSGDWLEPSELVSVLRSMSRDDLEVAVKLAHSMRGGTAATWKCWPSPRKPCPDREPRLEPGAASVNWWTSVCWSRPRPWVGTTTTISGPARWRRRCSG